MNKTDASALSYAISFLLLVGLMTSGALFMASTNKMMEVSLMKSEHLLFDNYCAFKKAIYNQTQSTQVIIHNSGDTSKFSSKPWGAFRVVSVETKNNKKVVKKSAIIGYSATSETSTLYCSDRSSSIQLAGDTKLNGLCFVPKKGVKRANLSGKNYLYSELIYGSTQEAESHIPKLNTNDFHLEKTKINSKSISQLKDTLYSFFEPVHLFQNTSSVILEGQHRGNLIIQSFDFIDVRKDAVLEHVILVAPRVRFESGFQGSVQVYAENEVICEPNVILTYPSSIIVQSKSEEKSLVNLGKGVEVYGAILLFNNDKNWRKMPSLLMQESTIAGLTYVEGQIQSSGNIHGTIYTEQFNLNQGGGQYVNYILDTHIQPIALKDFAYPYWKSQDLTHPEIIEWL